MGITQYVDEKDGRSYYRVRVVKKSAAKPGLVVDKQIRQISTFAEAEKVEAKLHRETERELILSEVKLSEWGVLVEEWYEAAWHQNIFTKAITRATCDCYREVLVTYTTEWWKTPYDKIDRAKAWMLMDRVERDVSISRRKRLRTAIDAVFSWAMLSGRISGQHSLPTEGFKSTRREVEKMPEILTIQEIRALLQAAKQMKNLWYPHWALALFTGMRSGELYALQWDSVDFDNQMIYVHRNWTNKEGYGPTKGRYWRAVPMGPQLEAFMKEQRLRRGSNSYVLEHFQSWTDGSQAEILRNFCVGIGLPSIKFHTLRACFATQLIRDGIAPAVVMKISGWKDLKTMQRYIRLAGIEVKGATNGLKLLPEEEVMGRVFELFGEQK